MKALILALLAGCGSLLIRVDKCVDFHVPMDAATATPTGALYMGAQQVAFPVGIIHGFDQLRELRVRSGWLTPPADAQLNAFAASVTLLSASAPLMVYVRDQGESPAQIAFGAAPANLMRFVDGAGLLHVQLAFTGAGAALGDAWSLGVHACFVGEASP